MSDISDSLLMGMRAAPHLDPAVIYGVAASTPDPSQVPTNAQATAGFSDALTFKNNLVKQDGKHQRSIWGGLSDSDQQALTAAGYKGPPKSKPSLFGRIGGALETVTSPIGSAYDATIGKGVDEGLHYLGAPLRQTQHLYRTFANIQQTNVADGGSKWSLNGVFSPSDWAKNWRETKNGEQTFDPARIRQIQGNYDPETFDLAKRLAGNVHQSGLSDPGVSDLLKAADPIIAAAPPDQRQALVQQIQSDGDLHHAVVQLVHSKLNLGQSIVGAAQLDHHPVLANLISGTANAVADFYGDPVMVAGKVYKADEAVKFGLPVPGKDEDVAKYLVRSAEDVERLAARPAVQNYTKDVASYLEAHANGDKQALGALIERYPKLANGGAQLLVDSGATSAAEVTDWLKSQAGVTAILQGQVSGMAHAVQQMPHVNQVGLARLAVKGALRDTIDWMAHPPPLNVGAGGLVDVNAPSVTLSGGVEALRDKLVTPVGRFAKALVTKVPKAVEFDPSSPDAASTLGRLVDMVLPADAARTAKSAFLAAPDLGAKKDIYKGILGEVFRAAGLDANPDTAKWAARFIDTLDANMAKRMYSTGGIDRQLAHGSEVASGILEPHLSETWGLPNFKTLWAQSKRASFTRSVFGAINADGIDHFMQSVWKPTTLMRLGFPIRAGGEELVSALLREGPLGILRGRLASGVVNSEISGDEKILGYHPVRATTDWVLQRHILNLSPETIDKIHTPADFVSEVIGDRARRAFRDVEKKLAGEKYVNGARELFEGGYLEGPFAREVSAVDGRAAGYGSDADSATLMNKSGSKIHGIRFQGNGDFKAYRPVDDHYTQIWSKNLYELQDSTLAKEALKVHDLPRDEAVQKVADFLESDQFASQWQRARRAHFLNDGSVVGVDATKRQAAEDWARTTLDHVDSIVRDANGEVIGDLPQRLLVGDAPKLADLNDIPMDRRPAALKGEETVPVPFSKWQSIVEKGFDQVVGRPMDWMIRQPLFLHNYVTAKSEVELLRGLGATDQMLTDVAVERAVQKTIPFIHDPRIRSQFAVVTRNLMPFWFAQEQFYKRWAMVLSHSPEAFREAQLMMMGVRHAGLVHNDGNGDYFMYPLVGQTVDVISKAVKVLTGKDVSIPMPVGFSGQVKFVTPGLERLGMPSFGPLVALPTHAIVSRFPELQGLDSFVNTSRGVGRSYWEQITPTTVSRLVHVLIDRPDTSSQMFSAMAQAAQYLDATGHGLPVNAGPDEIEAYQSRLKNWSRTILLTRTLYGYSAPAAPELALDPDHLNQEFRQLMNQLPFNEAVGEFIRRYPDATAYTVFQSKSAGQAPLPATTDAMNVLNGNRDFFAAHPKAASYFLPQAPGNFSAEAYREQLALQLRKHKDFNTFVRDISYADAADPFFKSKDIKDAALKAAVAAHDTHKAAQIRSAWTTWEQDFYNVHPIFADEYLRADGQVNRQETYDDLKAALKDPNAPKVSPGIPGLVDAYDRYTQFVDKLKGQRTQAATTQRANVKSAFTTWAKSYVLEHPDAQSLYDRVIRLQVGE